MALISLIRRGRLTGVALLPFLLAGCQTVHQVTIDAISSPSKPLGASYHLEVRDPSGGVEPALLALITSSVQDALGARGLYVVPRVTSPDMVITLNYGVGQGHIMIVTSQNTEVLFGGGIVPQNKSKAVVVFEKFIELSAREPVPKSAATTGPGGLIKPGEELWNIRGSIEDPKNEMAPYVPIITAAIVDYIGTNPGREVHMPLNASQAQELMQQHKAHPPAAK